MWFEEDGYRSHGTKLSSTEKSRSVRIITIWCLWTTWGILPQIITVRGRRVEGNVFSLQSCLYVSHSVHREVPIQGLPPSHQHVQICKLGSHCTGPLDMFKLGPRTSLYRDPQSPGHYQTEMPSCFKTQFSNITKNLLKWDISFLRFLSLVFTITFR